MKDLVLQYFARVEWISRYGPGWITEVVECPVFVAEEFYSYGRFG
jgi:hypothetical protein